MKQTEQKETSRTSSQKEAEYRFYGKYTAFLNKSGNLAELSYNGEQGKEKTEYSAET